MSADSVGASVAVRSGRRVSAAMVAVLAVLAALLVVMGPGAGASSPSSPLSSSLSSLVSSTPGAVGAVGVSGAVAAGTGHSLVIGADGLPYGTGYNSGGQLTGTGNKTTLTALTGLPAGVRGVAVAAGDAHTLVVGDDGVVYGTGNNIYGQLTGTGNKATLTALTGLPAGVRGVAAAAGWLHSLVVGDDGVVYGTGYNEFGQLTGTGDKATLTVLTGLPAGVRGVGVAAVGYHSLVVGDDGVVYGTGSNDYGQLTGTGNRTTLTALTGLPAGVRGLAAAAGGVHSLVVGDDGVVYGTGNNLYGQLTGTGDKATLTALTGLPAGVRGVGVAAGGLHSLVVGGDGVVYGTGFNLYGQLTGTGDKATLTALTGLPIDTSTPAVTLTPVTSPTNDPTPTFTGTGGRAIGDQATATLMIWQGPDTFGTLLRTYPGIKIDFWSGNWTTTVPGPDALPDGTYTARASQNDMAGNTGQSATRTFTVDTTTPDTTAPDTTITKHPTKKTFKRKAKFAFTSSEPGSTFQCKVDRKPWKACTSPYKVKVKPGKHKFQVRAIDAAGNLDPTPALWKWKVKPRS